MNTMCRICFFIILLFTVACQPKVPASQPPTSESSPTLTTLATSEPDLTPTSAILSALANRTATSPTQTTESQPDVSPVITQKPIEAPVDSWWNDTIFYEIFVRSFKDSDGDGVGDLNGLIEKLDYLNDGDPNTTSDLGITGIWLMPITESPSYHGYDVVDYYAVDQEYGSAEDFRRLIDEAHERGIKVIVDLVINHTGRDHPWFVSSQQNDPEYRDWYLWSDSRPNYLGPWGQQVWHLAAGSYYYGVFWDGMPDLNFENPEVTKQIYDITRYWLEDLNADGFRMDAIRHLIEKGPIQENTLETHAWLQGFHQYYKTVDPEAFTVGEAWTATEQVIEYIGDEMDIAFEFDLAESFVIAANGPIVAGLKEQVEKVLDSYPEGQYGVFLTNHDQDRVRFKLDSDTKAKLAATMLLTFPGVPFIYYGEEIGMIGSKPDEDIRLPMQWTGDYPGAGFTSGTPWRPPYSDFSTRNIANQMEDPESLLSHYRSLIGLRNEYSALRNGEATLVETDSPRLYALLRYDDEGAFLVLVNPYPKDLNTDLYALSLPEGPFEGVIQAETVLGASDPLPPAINPGGGFENYHPYEVIPAQSSMIIKLTP